MRTLQCHICDRRLVNISNWELGWVIERQTKSLLNLCMFKPNGNLFCYLNLAIYYAVTMVMVSLSLAMSVVVLNLHHRGPRNKPGTTLVTEDSPWACGQSGPYAEDIFQPGDLLPKQEVATVPGNETPEPLRDGFVRRELLGRAPGCSRFQQQRRQHQVGS